MESNTLRSKYRRVIEQGFMPICVGDRFDIHLLAEATLQAGGKAIEITCRRRAALKEIESVKRKYTDLLVAAGSVVDDGVLLQHLQRRQPEMPSIQQLLDAGVDGIVSALPLQLDTIARLSRTHLVIPGVETLTEAVQAIEHGAHMAKLFTADLTGAADRVRRLTCAATHGLVPFFVTGGITESKIREYLHAGVTMLGSGWDILLGDEYSSLQDRPDVAKLSASLRRFLEAFATHRVATQPVWREAAQLSDASLLERLSHYVPVAWTTRG